MKATLVVIGGKKAGMEIPISTPRFLIGRGDDCHIRPHSNMISRLHCVISVDKASVAIEDGAGAVGTFVNGEKIKWRHDLKHGDRITIGPLEFEVWLAADEAVASAKKQSVPNAQAVARAVAAANDGDADILNRVAREQGAVSAPPTAVTLQRYPRTDRSQDSAPAATTTHGRRESDINEYEEGFGWDAIGRVLCLATGSLFVFVLVMVLISFLPPELHEWHDVGWYWTRIARAADKWWAIGWVRWGLPTILASVVALLLAIRARFQQTG